MFNARPTAQSDGAAMVTVASVARRGICVIRRQAGFEPLAVILNIDIDRITQLIGAQVDGGLSRFTSGIPVDR